MRPVFALAVVDEVTLWAIVIVESNDDVLSPVTMAILVLRLSCHPRNHNQF